MRPLPDPGNNSQNAPYGALITIIHAKPMTKHRKPKHAPIRKPGPGMPIDGLLRFLGIIPRRKPLHHKPSDWP